MKYIASLLALLVTACLITRTNCSAAELPSPDFMIPGHNPARLDWSFLPPVVAEVDGQELSRQQLIDFIKAQMKLNPTPLSISSREMQLLAPQFVEEFLRQKLLLPLAIAAGFKPNPELVRQRLRRDYAQLPAAELAWRTRQLAQQGMSLEQFIERQASSPIIQNRLAIAAWAEHATAPAPPSAEELKKFYRAKCQDPAFDKIVQLRIAGDPPHSVRASHILIRPTDNTPRAAAEAKKRAAELLRRVQNGEDFATLARKYSDGPSKSNGGQIGYFIRGKMVKPFEEAAFKLKVGQISGVVKTKYGYHIIRREPSVPARYFPFEDVKDKLAAYLMKRRNSTAERQKQIEAFIQRQFEKAKRLHKVKIFVRNSR